MTPAFGFARIERDSADGDATRTGVLAVVDGDRAVALAALAELVDAGSRVEPPRTFVDLLSRWDAWCDDVERAVSRASAHHTASSTRVEYLPPVAASTVYCAGANYLDHIEEMTGHRPERGEGSPYHFVVPGGALVGHGRAVETPPGCAQLDWEVELVAVIGRRAERVGREDALEHVAGYTVANDISMRDFALRPDTPFGVDWLRSKAYATCLPMGPAIVPARYVPDPQDLAIRLWVGDELMQDSNTSEMLFTVAEQIEYLSAIVPLLPGDVISTGTPAGVGFARDRFLRPGDVVIAEIERVGRLVNPIA